MKFFISPLICGVLCLGVSACTKQQPSDVGSSSATDTQTQQIANTQAPNKDAAVCNIPSMIVSTSPLEYQLPDKIATQCQQHSNCPGIDIKLIQTGQAWIDNTINFGDANTDTNQGIAALKNNLDSEVKDYYIAESGSGGYGYYDDKAYHGCYQHLVQFVAQSDVYTGGAHGMYTATYYVFDTKAKKRIYLSDVVLDMSNLESLAKAAYDDYNRTLGMYEDRKDEQVPLAEQHNFYFAPDGLVIVASPYELGAFAEGIIELKIPYQKLTNVLKAEYLP